MNDYCGTCRVIGLANNVAVTAIRLRIGDYFETRLVIKAGQIPQSNYLHRVQHIYKMCI